MDENKSFTSVFEAAMSREERHNKRILNVLVLIIVLWFLTIAAFVWYVTLPVEESATTSTQTVDSVEDSEISQTIGEE